MSAKGINESIGKRLLYENCNSNTLVKSPFIFLDANDKENFTFNNLSIQFPWSQKCKLVAKPDQLIKRRGKLGLVLVNKDLETSLSWIKEKSSSEIKIGNAHGKLKNFIIEPFVEHTEDSEFYLCIYSERSHDTILFYHAGGVDVGNVDEKASKLKVGISCADDFRVSLTNQKIIAALLKNIPPTNQTGVAEGFQFMVGPGCGTGVGTKGTIWYHTLSRGKPICTNSKIYVLDMAAKIDTCAEYLCKSKWGDITFPTPFGREAMPEEAYILELDSKSGASLKLTILNPNGRIWTMVAGGGASVIYSDTICELGGTSELANYGEYSGAPSEGQTFEYAKTVLSLMTKNIDPRGKVLIIGGGIANFTNVATTFKGICRALELHQEKLQLHNISVYVRRAGPNYQEGLRIMRETGKTLGISIFVFGPETHMTAIVGMALGKREVPDSTRISMSHSNSTTANFLLSSSSYSNGSNETATLNGDVESSLHDDSAMDDSLDTSSDILSPHVKNNYTLFSKYTKAIVWGLQLRAVQSMLDFDYSCRREFPSVVAMVYPFSGDHKVKFYYGHKEILIPVYVSLETAVQKHRGIDVIVNFASLRSAFESTMQCLHFDQIKTVAIIAEGIPENLTRKLISESEKLGKAIIGPATVGGIKPGCFKIGNTGGMLDNILLSKLYRPGSVAYVSKSGGMSNELNNIISRTTNGVYEGVAIGGDKYPGTTFMYHIKRYEENPSVKIIVLLGELGGIDEYEVVNALKTKAISKPLVAWCIGTCSTLFSSEVQFGHAGALATLEAETSVAKNKALKAAGAIVPASFDELDSALTKLYAQMKNSGAIIVPNKEIPPPTVPMDYNWARELGLIRKPPSFMTSICDERGNELLYAGMPITQIFQQNLGLGGVLSLLWFQRRLPEFALKFIEMVLIVTADHGPAVSGAHNTIVCARAGKDLISCLASGLLTIGERFGGALDAAAKQFSQAYDSNILPMDFVNQMRKQGKLIMGIGHRVKSLNNPDKRVSIMREYVEANFPSTPLLHYATEVEKITTSKKPNLILNVDGFIGTAFVDLLRTCGCFTPEECREYIEIGALNGLFVLGRSIGFIGHYLDQRRLNQGLYRHPWDDISYVLPEEASLNGL